MCCRSSGNQSDSVNLSLVSRSPLGAWCSDPLTSEGDSAASDATEAMVPGPHPAARSGTTVFSKGSEFN